MYCRPAEFCFGQAKFSRELVASTASILSKDLALALRAMLLLFLRGFDFGGGDPQQVLGEATSN